MSHLKTLTRVMIEATSKHAQSATCLMTLVLGLNSDDPDRVVPTFSQICHLRLSCVLNVRTF